MSTERSPLTRRGALRLAGGSALALVAGATVLPGPVGARRVWCRADPTFRVDGIVGNVYVSGELDRVYDTTGPIQLRFLSPRNSVVELLSADAGFGQGYDISIGYDKKLRNDDQRIGLAIEVLVPAVSGRLPILVEFVPDGTVEVADLREGHTNQKIRVNTELRKPVASKSGESAPTPKVGR